MHDKKELLSQAPLVSLIFSLDRTLMSLFVSNALVYTNTCLNLLLIRCHISYPLNLLRDSYRTFSRAKSHECSRTTNCCFLNMSHGFFLMERELINTVTSISGNNH